MTIIETGHDQSGRIVGGSEGWDVKLASCIIDLAESMCWFGDGRIIWCVFLRNAMLISNKLLGWVTV